MAKSRRVEFKFDEMSRINQSTFYDLAVKRLLATVDVAVIRGTIGSRSMIADARLECGEPFSCDEIKEILGQNIELVRVS